MKIVFDTNAYRNLVKGVDFSDIPQKIIEVKKKEKEKNITTYISTIVAKELLAHIYDKNDKHFDSCYKAIKAMYNHCGDSENFNLLASPEIQIARDFFQEINTPALKTAEYVCQILFQFSEKEYEEIILKYHNNLGKIREHVISTEEQLAFDVYDWIRQLDSEATSWKVFENNRFKRREFLDLINSEKFDIQIASAMLCAVHINLIEHQINPKIKESEIQNMIKGFISAYKAPIELQRYFFKNFAFSNFDLTKKSRCNFIWDIQLLYVAGHTINNDDILLVTSDVKMTEEAHRINPSALIWNYETYMNYLDARE